jgi:hypothetical protein
MSACTVGLSAAVLLCARHTLLATQPPREQNRYPAQRQAQRDRPPHFCANHLPLLIRYHGAYALILH